MNIFEFTEMTYDLVKRERVKVADWAVIAGGLRNDCIIIQKITPATKRGDTIKKVIKVEDCNGFVYKLMKTKIKAEGGAEGLVKFFQECVDQNLMTCNVKNVLNYAWDKMKYMYL